MVGLRGLRSFGLRLGDRVGSQPVLTVTCCFSKAWSQTSASNLIILLIHQHFWIEIGRIELIRYDLESGERDLSIGDIGIRVCDLKLGLR